MWLSDAGEIIRNFHMWFKYGLKAQKLLEAVRPERAEALYIARYFKAFALTGRVFKIRLKSDAFIT